MRGRNTEKRKGEVEYLRILARSCSDERVKYGEKEGEKKVSPCIGKDLQWREIVIQRKERE